MFNKLIAAKSKQRSLKMWRNNLSQILTRTKSYKSTRRIVYIVAAINHHVRITAPCVGAVWWAWTTTAHGWIIASALKTRSRFYCLIFTRRCRVATHSSEHSLSLCTAIRMTKSVWPIIMLSLRLLGSQACLWRRFLFALPLVCLSTKLKWRLKRQAQSIRSWQSVATELGIHNRL